MAVLTRQERSSGWGWLRQVNRAFGREGTAVGNAWYVSPLTAENAKGLLVGEVAQVDASPSIRPTPNQVFAALDSFPEYRISVRRRDRKEKGQAVYIELRREDGSCAVDIHLLRVSEDDEPVGVFVFDYYRERDELVSLVSKMSEVCGPLVLWQDGEERSGLVSQPKHW